MQPPPSREGATLQHLVAVLGVGSHILGLVPVGERVLLRTLCRAFRAAVDESLREVRELYREDMSRCYIDTHEGRRDFAQKQRGVEWLIRACPKLQVFSLGFRVALEPSIEDRRSASLLHGAPAPVFDADKLGLRELGRCVHLRCLSLAGCAGVDGVLLAAVASSSRGLETLDVSGCDVDDVSLARLAASCPGLQRVNLSWCAKVTDEGIRSLVNGCRRLQWLDLRRALPRVSDALVAVIADKCADLCHLDIAGAGVTDRGIARLASRCSALQHLGLYGCVHVTEGSMMEVAEHCHSLRGLEIGWPPRSFGGLLTGSSVSAVAGLCPHFVFLEAAYLRMGHQLSFADMARTLSRVQHVDLTGSARVNDEAVRALAENCSTLRALDIKACRDVTGAGVACLAEHCVDLRELNVMQTAVSDASMVPVAQRCRQMRRLEIGRTRVTAATLMAVGESCGQLEYLDLMELSNFEGMDAGVAAIGRGCLHLQTLHASYCQKLSDEGVIPLVHERGGQLRELNVFASKITDASLQAISSSCTALLKLNAISCHSITEAGILAVVRGCRQLKVFCG
eukprot:jgi/Mesvir1/9373/Mv08988-RA.1